MPALTLDYQLVTAIRRILQTMQVQ